MITKDNAQNFLPPAASLTSDKETQINPLPLLRSLADGLHTQIERLQQGDVSITLEAKNAILYELSIQLKMIRVACGVVSGEIRSGDPQLREFNPDKFFV